MRSDSSGFTLTAQGTDASVVNPGESVDLSNTDGNIVVSKVAGTNDVTFDLADTITVGATNPVTINGDTGTVSGLTNTTFDPTATYTGGVAATQEQLSSASSQLAAQRLNFTANDATAGDVHRDLGQTLGIMGEATTAGTYSGANVKTVTDPATGAINVQIADAPVFTGTVTSNTGFVGDQWPEHDDERHQRQQHRDHERGTGCCRHGCGEHESADSVQVHGDW